MKTAIAKFSGYSSIFVTFKEAKILFKKIQHKIAKFKINFTFFMYITLKQ